MYQRVLRSEDFENIIKEPPSWCTACSCYLDVIGVFGRSLLEASIVLRLASRKKIPSVIIHITWGRVECPSERKITVSKA